MKKSVRTKSNDPAKILRMISRDEELERNDGKWVAMNRAYKNHKKYDRKRDKKVNLDPDSFLFISFVFGIPFFKNRLIISR